MSSEVNIDFPLPENRQELLEVKQRLQQKAKDICDSLEQIGGFSANQQSVPCDINDTTWLLERKCKIIENINNEKVELDLPGTDSEMLISLYETLVKENEKQVQVLENAIKELKTDEQITSALKEAVHAIESNMNTINETENNDPAILDLDALKTNTAKIFQELRQDLHTVIDSCFVEENIKELIQDLTKAYLKGGDERYIDVTDKYHYPHIALLKRANLVVEAPYDSMKIKFDM